MKWFKAISTLCVSIIVSGCASLHVPEVPPHAVPANASVGLLIDVGDNPTHAHVGTTIFNNFIKKYPYNWNMKEAIFQTYKEVIESTTNLKVINLDSYGVKSASQLDFVDVKDKQWSVVEANSQLRNKLTENNLYAIITVTEKPTLARLECGAGGCNERYIDGFGLFSRGFLGITNYSATAAFDITAEIINPPVELSSQQSLRNLAHFERKTKIISGFKPEDINNISNEELAPFRQHILKYVATVAEATTEFLR